MKLYEYQKEIIDEDKLKTGLWLGTGSANVSIKNKPPDQTGKHWKLSEETKRKQSFAKIGIKLSLEHRKKLSDSHKGIRYLNRKSSPLTEKHKENISITHRKSPYWLNKKHSTKTKEKISISKKGIKLSLITRQRMSVARRGSKNSSWKGGVTSKMRLLRRTLEYKLWREAIFLRDNWTCVWCGVRSAKKIKVILHADHIKKWSEYPELRFAVNNGRTLCADCHKKRHAVI